MPGRNELIYLDYHATTPVEEEVLNAMWPYFSIQYGNAASRSHVMGWQSDEAVEISRGQVAKLLGVEAENVFFTSGSTESLNMAIKGLAEKSTHIGRHIVTVATEHHAVLDPVRSLQKKGYEVSVLPVTHNGILDNDILREAIRKDTIMVTVMWANNETGVIQNMEAVVKICRDCGVSLVCDATQAAGKIPVDHLAGHMDMVSLSAHKMYGPKGVGAVYINQKQLKIKPEPLLHGGGHEKGFRSGTLNVPGIVGMGKAAENRLLNLGDEVKHLSYLRDYFESRIAESIEEVAINGHINNRLPGVSNILIRHVDSQATMSRFRSKLAISSGSACSSANPEPSHVLLAMGLSRAEAQGSFRFSFGVPTTREEVEKACEIFTDAIRMERELSPVWEIYKRGGLDMPDAS